MLLIVHKQHLTPFKFLFTINYNYDSHIPDGPGYQEKFYFNQGDTGFKVWKTRFATIGVAICWDQWFPEPARALALMVRGLYMTHIASAHQD